MMTACMERVVVSRPHLGLAVVYQLLVPEVWVDLHLHRHRLDSGVLQKRVDLFAAEVGNANGLDKAIINKLFHLLPCVLKTRV